MKFATKAIHAGQEPDPSTGAVMTPIFQTSTYAQKAPGDNQGYEYSRGTNPTRKALEGCLAALENAKYALAFSSGMGATDAVMKLLAPGDEVITGNDLYGGSYRIFTKIFANYGIKFHFLDLSDPEIIRQYTNENTKMVWIETPTNPTMQIVDIEAIGKITKEKNLTLVVDNTFASPYLQNPMDLGATIVMHSVTKYIGGHSDVVMGALMLNDEELYKRLWFIYNACGATPGPMDSFLVLRGIKTLHLRMKAHCENGRAIAEFLKDHPKVAKIYWPGFTDHPNHEVAKKQMRDFGGMISITLKDADLAETFRIAGSFKVFTLAESLGGVESLINHPATMTHGSIPKEVREKVGVVDSLLRLSVGVEDIEDLLEDLKQALSPPQPPKGGAIMEDWLQNILSKWRSEGVKLNPPASVAEIENAETTLSFKFPLDFKDFYLQANGFADFYMQEEMFTLWPIKEIIEAFGFEAKEFVGFCDYLVNSHSIGYSKKFEGIFKDYEHVSDSVIAKTFKELIEIINSNPAIAY